jgi:hypothetical protein
LTCIIASFVKQNQAISFCFVPWSDYFSKLDKLSKFVSLPFRKEFTDRNFAGNPRWVEVNYAQTGMTTNVDISSLFSLLLLFHSSPTWLAFHNGPTTTLYHRSLLSSLFEVTIFLSGGLNQAAHRRGWRGPPTGP